MELDEKSKQMRRMLDLIKRRKVDPIPCFEFTPNGDYHFFDLFVKAKNIADKTTSMTFIGFDWAKGSGMNRGEIIARHDNVVYVRFKTVDRIEVRE